MLLGLYMFFWLVLTATAATECGEQCVKLQTFVGKIGSGNFTYYRLTRDGDLSLVLETVEGDTDIYVSQSTMSPDYNNYDLKSATCGTDVVDIPKGFKRPIGVGIYGHVFYPASTFKLHVMMDYPTDHYEGASGFQSHQSESEEESLLWTIFVSILKILFDILL